MRRLLPFLAALALGGSVEAAPGRQGYTAQESRLCGGYPQLAIGMAEGMCAGLVYGPPADGLRQSRRLLHLPRTLLALPGGDMLVVDLGSWDAGKGAVWRLRASPGTAPKLTRLLGGLNLPHTIAFGPDGAVYLGEMDRIVRFDPAAPAPAASVEVVVAGLPRNRLHEDRHPLSSFLFDGNGDLLVNVGAPSDQCPPPKDDPTALCAEAGGDRPAAAIWRYAYLGRGRWAERPRVFATGLRNSLALARHRSGVLLQGENSIDVADPHAPYDEINRLEPGRDYGWPYCVDASAPAPAWRGRTAADCAGRAKPVLLLPPHAAPLSMLYYEGAMFPALAGRLIVGFHGYRATGGRIVAYAVDAQGAPVAGRRPTDAVYRPNGAAPSRRRFTHAPAADGMVLTPGWDRVGGARPLGAPAGLAVAADGTLWAADDRNGAIIRLARAAP